MTIEEIESWVRLIVTPQIIAKCAYLTWLQEGCPDGQADRHWLEAERALVETVRDELAKPQKFVYPTGVISTFDPYIADDSFKPQYSDYGYNDPTGGGTCYLDTKSILKADFT